MPRTRSRNRRHSPLEPGPRQHSTPAPLPGRSPLRSQALISALFIGGALGLLAIRNPHASADDWTLVGVAMLLAQLSAVGTAVLSVRPMNGPRTRLAIAIAVALLAGAMLFATSDRSLGAWLAAIAALLARLLDARGSAENHPGRFPLVVAATSSAWFVLLTVHRWHAGALWLMPIALLGALALHLSTGISDTRRVGRRLRLALAALGLSASFATIVLVFSVPGGAIFVAIDGALALFLAPRTLKRFGERGFAGLIATSALSVAAAFAIVI